MKAVIATVITLFSLISGLMFVFSLMPGMISIYLGDTANGTESIVNATVDEVVGSVQLYVVVTVAIAVASALGLTSIIALLKKL